MVRWSNYEPPSPGSSSAIPDGRELAAVLTANAHLSWAFTTGMLSLDDVRTVVDIDGNESALRCFFEAPLSKEPLTRDRRIPARLPSVVYPLLNGSVVIVVGGGAFADTGDQ